MGLCKKCYDRFPPDFMSELEGDDLECIFCKLDKKELTITTEEGFTKKYTKEECKKEYETFLNMIKMSPTITEQLKKAEAKSLSN